MTSLSQNLHEQLMAGAEKADRSTDWPAHPGWPCGMRAYFVVPSLRNTAVPAGPPLINCARARNRGMLFDDGVHLESREAAVRRLLKGPAALIERYLPLRRPAKRCSRSGCLNSQPRASMAVPP